MNESSRYAARIINRRTSRVEMTQNANEKMRANQGKSDKPQKSPI